MSRRLTFVADFDGELADVLAACGVSTSVRTALRKTLGLVCKIDGGREIPVKLTEKLKRGDSFCIYLVDSDVKQVPKWDAPVKIVYEDEDVAVVDKSAGMAVIPVKGFYGKSLANALANVWGDFVYRPVNRLDRDTSGLMIVAKNRLAHGVLAKAHLRREYVGLCQGIFEGNCKGTLDLPLKTVEGGFKRYVCDGGERAVTHYEILRQYGDYFSARFVLETGRTHQIRAHMAHMGHPLCCDRLYNPNPRPTLCPNGFLLERQALHSCKLQFKHPIDKRELSFVSRAEFLEEV